MEEGIGEAQAFSYAQQAIAVTGCVLLSCTAIDSEGDHIKSRLSLMQSAPVYNQFTHSVEYGLLQSKLLIIVKVDIG